MVLSRSFVISMHHEVMETANSQKIDKSLPTLLFGYNYRIQGIYLKHGLNIGRDTYSVLAICLQVQ